MKTKGTHLMGRCSVDIEIANNKDLVEAGREISWWMAPSPAWCPVRD